MVENIYKKCFIKTTMLQVKIKTHANAYHESACNEAYSEFKLLSLNLKFLKSVELYLLSPKLWRLISIERDRFNRAVTIGSALSPFSTARCKGDRQMYSSLSIYS